MITYFTKNSEVEECVKKASELKSSGKRFSDVEDKAGLQYVDLVQEGGGVLGIALVGYTYILEKAGIRFFSLAGTSAGAINTILIAGLAKPGDEVSEKILTILSQKNLFELVDGNDSIKSIIQKLVNKEKGILLKIILNIRTIYKTLRDNLGFNPGNNFKDWLSAELGKNGIFTLHNLTELRKQLPEGLRYIADETRNEFEAKLAVISSEITTHTKAEFPRMAGLYWKNPETVSPAEFVRASMSIPFFFEPYIVRNIPSAGQANDPGWYEFARYSGEVPPETRFVDGGMLSNFPINVFHCQNNLLPRKPTFGVRLSVYRQNYSKTGSLKGMCGGMISTMRQIHDYDFLLKNPDYSRLICRIDADSRYNWLNFNISKEEQLGLFVLGAQKAIAFLEAFEWEEYKTIRKNIGINN